MTKDEFRDKIKKHGFNLQSFADFINLKYSTVSKWGKTIPVPSWVGVFLTVYDELEELREAKRHLQKLVDAR